MEVILVKFVTLNYPRFKTEINPKMRKRIDAYFEWVEHDTRVLIDYKPWGVELGYKIYDPEHELQDLFDEVSTMITDEDDIRALLWDTVVTVIDENTGIDSEEPLGTLRPYTPRHNYITRRHF